MSRCTAHVWVALAATAFAALLPSASATDCLFYTTKQTCERYTDTGTCRWDAKTRTCLAGGKKLPPGAFGVALAGLNPDTAPLVLKPGPSSSSGSVSLGKGPSLPVRKLQAAEQGASNCDIDTGVRTPSPEPLGAFCTLPAEPGRCRAAIPRWRWDAEVGRCVEFVWGGCGGNANRFETPETCEAAAQVACV